MFEENREGRERGRRRGDLRQRGRIEGGRGHVKEGKRGGGRKRKREEKKGELLRRKEMRGERKGEG